MPGADGLEVAIVGKRFGSRPVLDRVGFSAMPGEILALLAPSGTGKTTALRIVTGLDPAFTGSIRRPEGRLGCVFQEPLLLPWMDVVGNLRLVAPNLADHEATGLLAMVGLPGVESWLPKQLSLGMARRVAVARALAARPSLLVMDEPFASLDPRLAAALARDVAATARARGCITLLATHDLDQALTMADRLLVLEGHAPATLAADLQTENVTASDVRSRFPFLVAA